MSKSAAQQRADQTRQENLDFIYGNKNKEASIYDLDKRSHVKSAPKISVKTIDSFENEYAFLSPSFPCSVHLYDEIIHQTISMDSKSTIDDHDTKKSSRLPYPSFEHALQASKLKVLDPKREEIRNTIDIREVKRMIVSLSSSSSSSSLSYITQQEQQQWKANCLIVGEKILRDKFFRNKGLKSLLMKTKRDGFEALIYKNNYRDIFWGVSPITTTSTTTISEESSYTGQNHLGILLLKVRREIDGGDDTEHWLHAAFDPITQLIPAEEINIKISAFKEKQPRDDSSTNNKSNNYIEENGEALLLKEEDSQIFQKRNIVFMGKTDESDYIARHPSISRVHGAIIAHKLRGVLYLDLGSANGSTVSSISTHNSSNTSSVQRITTPAFIPISIPSSTPTCLLKLGASTRVYKIDMESSATSSHYRVMTSATNDIHSSNNNSSSGNIVTAADIKTEFGVRNNNNNSSGHNSNNTNNNTSSSSSSNNKEKESDDLNTVFVSNIANDITEKDLYAFFASCGSIKKLSYPLDKATKQPRGIAFVTFDGSTMAGSRGLYEAISRDGDVLLGGEKILIRRSTPKPSSQLSQQRGQDKTSQPQPPQEQRQEREREKSYGLIESKSNQRGGYNNDEDDDDRNRRSSDRDRSLYERNSTSSINNSGSNKSSNRSSNNSNSHSHKDSSTASNRADISSYTYTHSTSSSHRDDDPSRKRRGRSNDDDDDDDRSERNHRNHRRRSTSRENKSSSVNDRAARAIIGSSKDGSSSSSSRRRTDERRR